MNKQKLSGMQYKQVKTRPIARRIDPTGAELPPIDDKWIVSQTDKQELNLRNTRTDQSVRLGMDHVREYVTDAGRSDGFLILKSQIFTFARGAAVEPLC
jgi:hypothetical protein